MPYQDHGSQNIDARFQREKITLDVNDASGITDNVEIFMTYRTSGSIAKSIRLADIGSLGGTGFGGGALPGETDYSGAITTEFEEPIITEDGSEFLTVQNT